MIITCEKCSTSFNLDDAMVKADGSKVRCSVCRHIFLAYPPPAEEDTGLHGTDPEPGKDVSPVPEAYPDEPEFSQDAPPDPDDDFSITDDDLSIESNDLSVESSELELEDSGFEIEDSEITIDSTELGMEDAEPEMEIEPALSGLEMAQSDFSPEAEEPLQELELEDVSPMDDDPDFELDDDFSFEEDDFQAEPDAEDGDPDFEIEPDHEISGLEMEESSKETDDPDLEADDSSFELDEPELELELEDDEPVKDLEVDDQMAFDADPGAISTEPEDEFEFDGLEFEPLDDSVEPAESVESGESSDPEEFQTEFDFDDGESGLALETENETDPASPGVESDPEPDMEEEDFELEFDITEDDGMDSEGEPAEEMELELDSSDSDDTAEPPVIKAEDDFSEYDEVLEQETEPDETVLEKETVDVLESDEKTETLGAKKAEENEPLPRSRRRKKKKSLIGTPTLILLLLFFLVAGAYVASIMTGIKLPYLSDVRIPFIENLLKKPPVKAVDVNPVINPESTEGRFVNNSNAGNLFVITGKVENPSNVDYKHIQIIGSLFIGGDVEVKTQKAYSGNIITEEMLEKGHIADMNKLMGNKAGNHDTNLKIRPGGTIPFMLVFSDLPDKLENFRVRIHSFEKVPTP
ncbi:MAG: zinc-ribbon domain-containing protein [Desulfobacterales bacterium]|nr:zinc-ribbon domain-containing protein [Desulfobacterales bacterium]